MLFDTPAAKAALHAKVRLSRRTLPPVIAAPACRLGWRRGLRLRGWLCGRLKPRQRGAQRVEARGARKAVVFDGAPDCRCYRGELVGGEVNCRHGLAAPSR